MFLKILEKSSWRNYGSCPIHYLCAPALSCDVMLNITKVELELVSDATTYLFFEIGMRVRVSYISKKYSQVKNK